MNIRTAIAALAFSLVAASSFAGAPTPTNTAGFQKVAATTSTAPVAAKKPRCPKGEHRVSGKCVKK